MLAALGRILKAEGIETDSIKLLIVGEIGMANAPGVSISFSNDLYSVNGADAKPIPPALPDWFTASLIHAVLRGNTLQISAEKVPVLIAASGTPWPSHAADCALWRGTMFVPA
mgnify:FL=1